MARVEEEVDLSPLPSSELIDRPRRDGRLPQTLDLLRFLALAGLAQLADEPVALGDERAWFERVEAIELGFEAVYSYLPPNGSATLFLPPEIGGARGRPARFPWRAPYPSWRAFARRGRNGTLEKVNGFEPSWLRSRSRTRTR